MKVTPIMTSILVNAFALVGFISVVFILCMKIVLGEQPKLSCINDRNFDFVSSHHVNGEQYELIKYTSGVSEKVNFLGLYNRKNRIAGCIPQGKEISIVAIHDYYQDKEENKKQFPQKILISNNQIQVSYSESPQGYISNLPVIWDMKAKLAAR